MGIFPSSPLMPKASGAVHEIALDEKNASVHSGCIQTYKIDRCLLKMALSQNCESPNRCAFEGRIFLSIVFPFLLFV
jgi:hypothetical protein